MRTGHLHLLKGKRVIVHFRDPDRPKVEGRFKEYKGRFVILEDGQRFSSEEVRTVSYLRSSWQAAR